MIVFSADQVGHRYITFPTAGRRRIFLRLSLCYRWILVLATPWICFWFIANLMTPTPWQVWAFRNRNVLAPVVCINSEFTNSEFTNCRINSNIQIFFLYYMYTQLTKGWMDIWRNIPDVLLTILTKTQNADLAWLTRMAYFRHWRPGWAQSFLLHSTEQFDMASVFPRCYDVVQFW